MRTADKKYPVIINRQHRPYCKKLAKFLAEYVEFQMSRVSLVGLDAALLINFGLSATRQTLLTIYGNYKKALDN